MGDDIGWFNLGSYNQGIMLETTPNLDKLATEGMRFTDYYAEASSNSRFWRVLPCAWKLLPEALFRLFSLFRVLFSFIPPRGGGGRGGRQDHLHRKDVLTVRFDAGRAPFRKCHEEVARTRPLNSHLSALPLQDQRLIPRRVLRRQQAEERKSPFIAIISKEGDDWFVL